MLNFQIVSSETPEKVEVAKARQELELTVSHGVRSYKDPTPISKPPPPTVLTHFRRPGHGAFRVDREPKQKGTLFRLPPL